MAKPKVKTAKKSGKTPVKKSAAKKSSKPAAKKAKAAAPAKSKKTKSKPKAKSASKPAKKMAAKTGTKTAAKTSVKAPVKAPAKMSAKDSARTVKHENISKMFSPLDDRVIIEAVEAATRTAGGLFIPDTVDASDRPQQGKVLAVGRGHRMKKGRIRPLDVQLGDTVLFETYAGSPILIGARECIVIRESELLGIVKV